MILKSRTFPGTLSKKKQWPKKRITFLIPPVVLTLLLFGSIVRGQEFSETSFAFIFAGYDTRWNANEAIIIDTSEALKVLINEFATSEYVPYLPTLLPELEKPNFIPVVDFNSEVVIGVVGQLHDTSCKKANVISVKRNVINDIEVTLQEESLTPCDSPIAAPSAHPVVLIKLSRPVAEVVIQSVGP